MEITFVNHNYLWLLLIIPALILTHFYSMKFARRKAMKFSNFEALARVTGGMTLSMNLPVLFLRFFTLLFLILALSQPILWYMGSGGNSNFVLAIDSSGSMLADDFSPDRLEAAKAAALEFTEILPSDSRVAVLSFSGTSFLKESLTEELGRAKEAIKNIDVEYSSGTAIGDAIIAASNVLMEEEKGRSVILITDGQSNVGTIIEKAINYANDRFITVNTIGMATEQGGRFEGIEAISRLDTDSLKTISSNTGGKFYLAQNNEQLNTAYSEIARTSQRKMPIKLSLWLIILTFITLSIEWIFVNTKFRSVP